MILIGLAGSTMARRDNMGLAIATAGLEMAGGPRRLARLAICSPEPGKMRDEIMRAERTRDRIDDMRGSSFSGAVMVHVMCEAEAKVIRARGGEIWHVEGMPSDSVVIHWGDRLVTDTEGGSRHYLDAVEALSEMAMAAKTKREARAS
ncbi:hypothetical protein F0A16_20565 [Salinicola corii]|uniref:Uncharacterized protein n=1 Tax=Salinicola corii TaxID=2606937 RepID=A0A640W8I0_9GAMM|nr:hypothetical protein [Salinicola corii]KAA0015484.1 hypothetical protein F0A16_20565 [Salinicola corii]